MTEKTEKTVKALIVRDFNDAGTEKSYVTGAIVDMPEGAFMNYEAAGLVRAPGAEDAKAPAKNA